MPALSRSTRWLYRLLIPGVLCLLVSTSLFPQRSVNAQTTFLGFVDGVTSEEAFGWACDTTTTAAMQKPVAVAFVRASDNQEVARVTAGQVREDLSQVCGGYIARAWKWDYATYPHLQLNLRDGNPYAVHAYMISADSSRVALLGGGQFTVSVGARKSALRGYLAFLSTSSPPLLHLNGTVIDPSESARRIPIRIYVNGDRWTAELVHAPTTTEQGTFTWTIPAPYRIGYNRFFVYAQDRHGTWVSLSDHPHHALSLGTAPPQTASIQAASTANAPMIEVGAQAGYGGQITSLRYGGIEMLDVSDHGRGIAGASGWYGFGECYNPTEAGSQFDRQSPVGSSWVQSLETPTPMTLRSRTQMAYWAPRDTFNQTSFVPNDPANPPTCGSVAPTLIPNTNRYYQRSQSPATLSKHVYQRTTTLQAGTPAIWNAISVEGIYDFPEGMALQQAGDLYFGGGVYMRATANTAPAFRTILTYNPCDPQLSAPIEYTGNGKEWPATRTEAIIVEDTTTGTRLAVGMYANPAEHDSQLQLKYAVYRFHTGSADDTTLLATILRNPSAMDPVDYASYLTRYYLVYGDRQQVINGLRALAAQNGC